VTTASHFRKSRPLSSLLCVAFFLTARPLNAQGLVPCVPQDYKLLSESALAIKCTNEVYPSGTASTVTGSGTVYLLGDTSIAPLKASAAIGHFSTTNRWLLVTLSGPESVLKPKQKYRLIFGYSVTDSGGHSTSAGPPINLDVDTTETVAIAAGNVKTQPQLYKATSHVAFSSENKQLAFEQLDQAGFGPCQIPVQDDTKKSIHVSGRCSKLRPFGGPAGGPIDFTGVDPFVVGRYQIMLDQVPSAVLIPADLQLQDVFGGKLKVDPKSRFSPQKPPATKDASQYYGAFNYAAGVGSVPAWVLDGKVAPQFFRDGFLFGPVATANVGNNKLKGQTYTDTIDFGGTAQRLFQPGPILQELLLSFGPTYETDKEFDRENLLATADLRYNFVELYRTQSIGTLQKFYAALRDSETKKSPYTPQLDDMKPVLYGYALDFHTGLEAGGALVDTTVKASSGKATQTLPTYSIFRVVPQVHGLLEIWKFSIDETMTGRYLVTTENTVVETATHSLFLKQVQGWKGISTLTGIYNWDSQGHFAINNTFKDGFAPPTYQRVNAVQAGILVKY
jgi:hypothetical protein